MLQLVNMSKICLRYVDFAVIKFKWKQISNLFLILDLHLFSVWALYINHSWLCIQLFRNTLDLCSYVFIDLVTNKDFPHEQLFLIMF